MLPAQPLSRVSNKETPISDCCSQFQKKKVASALRRENESERLHFHFGLQHCAVETQSAQGERGAVELQRECPTTRIESRASSCQRFPQSTLTKHSHPLLLQLLWLSASFTLTPTIPRVLKRQHKEPVGLFTTFDSSCPSSIVSMRPCDCMHSRKVWNESVSSANRKKREAIHLLPRYSENRPDRSHCRRWFGRRQHSCHGPCL